MPEIVLKTTSPGSKGDGAAPQIPDGAGPLFRGNGDTDYLCGNCRFAIAAGMGERQHVIVDSTVCPACGATNEFPPEARS